ncbi:vacuolar membrane protein-domain-containing protein [Hysterangium stoloniferum]|nr:vacuolar membrane protein-domain-containing protein [Hysterangium stoloniferum]
MSFSFPPRQQLNNLESGANSSSFPYLQIKRECRLLGPTALIVQGLMGALVILSLVYKRQRETPMRPWAIWSFDVSKQVLGQAFVHGLNILISDLIADVAQGNPCDLYFLNILVDTTMGIGYIYLVLNGIDALFTNRLRLEGFKSGEYGDPPRLTYWARQASVYVFTILTMKLLVVGLFAVWPGIFNIAEFLLSWTDNNIKLRVIFVMGLFPIIMNILQFWIIDSIVKASTSISTATLINGNDTDREPLFHDPGSDSDNDETARAQRRYDIESPPTPQQPKLIQPPKANESENKPNASGSSSVMTTNSSSIQLHPYPPTSAFMLSATSSPASSSSSISSLRSKKSRRRSPPPPIQQPPPYISQGVDYMISMTPSPMMNRSHSISQINTTPSKPRQRRTASQTQMYSEAPVQSDSQTLAELAQNDNWAGKVGEKELTGRRLRLAKAGLEAWDAQTSVEVS